MQIRYPAKVHIFFVCLHNLKYRYNDSKMLVNTEFTVLKTHTLQSSKDDMPEGQYSINMIQ